MSRTSTVVDGTSDVDVGEKLEGFTWLQMYGTSLVGIVTGSHTRAPNSKTRGLGL